MSKQNPLRQLLDMTKLSKVFERLIDPAVSPLEKTQQRKEIVESFKARSDRNRNWSERLADNLSAIFGSVEFILLNALWFGGWIAWNTNLIPGVVPFDPFPFGLLTTAVSLEAIFLSLFILVTQNRASKVEDVREEVDLNINLLTEQEVTKLLHMVDDIHRHLGLTTKRDHQLENLKKTTSVRKIEADIEQSMEDAK